MSQLYNNVIRTIKASGHKYCTVQYIFENMDTSIETSGDLNVAIIAEAKNNPNMELPIHAITGYISTKCVREEYKESVSKELVQDHNDLAFAKDQLATTDTGYVYAYGVREPEFTAEELEELAEVDAAFECVYGDK